MSTSRRPDMQRSRCSDIQMSRHQMFQKSRHPNIGTSRHHPGIFPFLNNISRASYLWIERFQWFISFSGCWPGFFSAVGQDFFCSADCHARLSLRCHQGIGRIKDSSIDRRWIDRSIVRSIDRSMDGWMDGSMDRPIVDSGWMDRWMDQSSIRSIYRSTNRSLSGHQRWHRAVKEDSVAIASTTFLLKAYCSLTEKVCTLLKSNCWNIVQNVPLANNFLVKSFQTFFDMKLFQKLIFCQTFLRSHWMWNSTSQKLIDTRRTKVKAKAKAKIKANVVVHVGRDLIGIMRTLGHFNAL